MTDPLSPEEIEVKPWSAAMIAWLRRSTPGDLEPRMMAQLADIAEDHARMVADLEAHRSLSRNQTTTRRMTEYDRVELWDAINAVVAASGGSTGNTSVARQKAVVLVDQAVDRLADRRGWTCIRHRCAAHYDVPTQNTNEASGSECGGCIAAERNALRAENEQLVGDVQVISEDYTGLRDENADLKQRLADMTEVGWCEVYTGSTPAQFVEQNTRLIEHLQRAKNLAQIIWYEWDQRYAGMPLLGGDGDQAIIDLHAALAATEEETK